MTFSRYILTAGALLSSALCPGRELLTLQSGFTLEASCHASRDGNVVVNTATGTVSFPEAEIARIDPLPDLSVDSAAPPKVQPPSVEDALAAAASEQGLAPVFVHSVAKIESGLLPTAVSGKGAIGLMQLMPRTAAELGVSAADPQQNARGGAKYLRQLLLAYKGDAALALAAYNAGPAAVARFGGVPPYPETRRYVMKVLREMAAAAQGKDR